MYLSRVWHVGGGEAGDEINFCHVARSKEEDKQVLNNFVIGCESIYLLDNGWIEIAPWPDEYTENTLVPPNLVHAASGNQFVPGEKVE